MRAGTCEPFSISAFPPPQLDLDALSVGLVVVVDVSAPPDGDAPHGLLLQLAEGPAGGSLRTFEALRPRLFL